MWAYLFPGGRALKLIKTGVNVANETNPLLKTKNVTLVNIPSMDNRAKMEWKIHRF